METKVFKTSDLPLAAYLVIHGLEILDAQKTSQGKFEFVLKDEQEQASKLSVEFINSDFCKFDNTIRALKKLLYTK